VTGLGQRLLGASDPVVVRREDRRLLTSAHSTMVEAVQARALM
jgi:hypothetical protein